jgi:ankyrin repeat protein
LRHLALKLKQAERPSGSNSDAGTDSELSHFSSHYEEGPWEDAGMDIGDRMEDQANAPMDPSVTSESVRDSLTEDPDPTFNDTMPREPLKKLIDYYIEILPRLRDVEHPERAEHLQRRLIEYAEDWNQMYEPPVEVEPMRRGLSDILAMQEDNPAKLNEAIRNLKEHFPKPPEQSSRPRCQPEPSLDAHTRLEQASFAHDLAKLHLQRYQSAENQEALDLAEKYAKRCFKLRFELRHEPNSEFLKSVNRLVEVLKLQKHAVEAKVFLDLYPEGTETVTVMPNGLLPSSSTEPTQQSSPPDFASWRHIDDRDGSGHTPLICAVVEKDAQRFDRYIESGADVEVPDSRGQTPLLHAVHKEDEQIILKLKGRGANIDAVTSGQTVLHHAICMGSQRMVRFLLENGAGIEFPGPSGLTPLLHAVSRGKVDADISDNTEDESVEDDHSKKCCPHKSHAGVVLALCKGQQGDVLQRPKLNARDRQGWTVLQHAMGYGRLEILETLLNKGADVHELCSDGKAPLHYAVVRKDEPSARLLLKKGANVNVKDKGDRTPLLSAVRQADSYNFVKLLLDNDAEVEWDKIPKDLNNNISGLLRSHSERRFSLDSSTTASSSRSWSGLPRITSRRRSNQL